MDKVFGKMIVIGIFVEDIEGIIVFSNKVFIVGFDK